MRAFMAARTRLKQSTLAIGQLQVVYDAEERARWVIFASTAEELDDALLLIGRADCGDPAGTLEMARSLADGTRGLPLDRVEAYRWALIASRSDGGEAAAADAGELAERLGGRLAPEVRERIAVEATAWRPRTPCGG
jgi:hypothetical protein